MVHTKPDEILRIQEKLTCNPLISAITGVLGRVNKFKERAREYYFEVILSPYQCPVCERRLHMTGQSECSCSCGNSLDPTLAFQKSSCCCARLTRKTFHYACSVCNNIVSSRFLFDERVFDKEYFREMMQESRRRKEKKREEISRLLAETRSDTLSLIEDPHLESIPGLIMDLDAFIQNGRDEMAQSAFDMDMKSVFKLNDYRDHILSVLTWDSILFSNIAPLIDDDRHDRVGRFITLIFMQNDQEVDLTQNGDDIWVQRRYNEAYS